MSSLAQKLAVGAKPPLCVDLDGTLLRSDLLLESVLVIARRQPIAALWLLRKLRRGRAAFKQAIADGADVDVSSLPYHDALLDYVRDEHENGRYTVLVTAAARKPAEAVAQHLGCFDDVMASTAHVNLKGSVKADALCRRFGERRFTYAGDSRADVPVWAKASAGLLVGGSRRTERAARAATTIEAVLERPVPLLAAALRAMRPHQWLKNLLVFVPLLAGHHITAAGLAAGAAAFAAFCLAASAAYLLNDLLDLDVDRTHPTKRRRPLPSGALPIAAAAWLIPALAAAGIGAAIPLGAPFVGCITAYFCLTVAYSLYLKRRPVVDVMTLASLYTLRVVAGGAAAGIALSFWLLAFSTFLFLSLALVKRTTEVQLSLATRHDLSRRGYLASDADSLRSMGVSSGYLAVLVAALYIDSDDVARLYQTPQILWLLCPVALYWMNRIWLKASRGEMDDDPLVFTIRDRPTLILVAVSAIIVLGAL